MLQMVFDIGYDPVSPQLITQPHTLNQFQYRLTWQRFMHLELT